MNQGEFNDMLRAAVNQGIITQAIGDFLANGTVPMTGTLNLGTHRITGMSDATGATDGVSRGFGDARFAPISVTGDFQKDGSVPMTGTLNLGTHRITGMSDATGVTDGVSRGFGDARFAAIASIGVTLLDTAGAVVVGNGATGTIGVQALRVVGPATYTTDGIPFDFSAKFSKIVAVLGHRQFSATTGKAPAGAVVATLLPIEAGTDTFANAKLRMALARNTSAGTVAAPTITTISNAVPTAIGTSGGALAQVAGASGITGVQAPAYTGSAQGGSEVTNGSGFPNGNTYEVTIIGVLL